MFYVLDQNKSILIYVCNERSAIININAAAAAAVYNSC